MKPLVSVVMPVFNSENYLKETIDSLVNQSLKDIEIICVDDGSDDDSLKVLMQYREIDERINIITKEHSNAGDARNAGMAKASGEYLIFLDADDFFLPNMLETAYDKADKSQADIVVFAGYNFSTKDGSRSSNKGLLTAELLPDEEVFNLRQYPGHISFSSAAPWNKLFRRSFIVEQGLQFQSLPSANDMYFVTMAMLLARRIATISDELIGYRIDNPNSLQGSREKSPYDGIVALLAIYEELRRLGVLEIYRRDFNERCAAMCLYLLRRIDNEEVYGAFYNTLKGDFLHRVGIDQSEGKDFLNQALYKEINDITTKKTLQYLLDKNKALSRTGTVDNWLFPFGKIKKGSEIVLYGAGNVGKCFYKQIKKTDYCKIAAWFDKRAGEFDGMKITPPNSIGKSCDNVVIAISSEKVANEIRKELMDIGVGDEKMIWEESYHI